jgi:energy-coupling factor transporter transmembrane protein EcfT
MFGSSAMFSSNPILEFIWWMLMFYLFFIVIMMFIQVFADIFRRENLSGWGKAGWIFLLFILPFIGILIYMIARPKNTEQDQRLMAEAQAAQARLVGGSAADDIAKAKGLLDSGAITQAEFDSIKAKALA